MCIEDEHSVDVARLLEEIRRLIKESDGDSFEEARSLEQNLSFDSAYSAFRSYGVEFALEKYRALGLTRNGLYTNLAWLLSDQCLHTTKIAVYKDERCTEFRDSKEFGGSVLLQFEKAVDYLALCNKTASSIQGMRRIDTNDYPAEALREALLNALVHRDYGFSGSIIINVNDRQIEFISLGGLLPGLSKEDILLGISQPRNRKLAEIFHRLGLIESYGTGLRRIFKLYASYASQPYIEVAPHAFKIVLPNMNAMPAGNSATPTGHAHDATRAGQDDDGTATWASPVDRTAAIGTSAITATQMQATLDYLAQHGEMSEVELQELLGVKKGRAYQVARRLRDNGLIEVVGRGASKRYRRR